MGTIGLILLVLLTFSGVGQGEAVVVPDDPDGTAVRAEAATEEPSESDDIAPDAGVPWECDMAKVSREGLDLIKRFEGCVLHAYRDPVGVWTIGYGHTGPDVRPGMTITLEEAEELLRRDLRRFEECVQNSITRAATQAQFDAMVSFAFNVGCGRSANPARGVKASGFKGSTLLKKFNAGDVNGAAREFGRWVYAGGRIMPGLVRRRAAEAQRFLEDD